MIAREPLPNSPVQTVDMRSIPVPISVRCSDPAAAQFGADLVEAMTQLRRYALWLAKNSSLADDLIQDAILNAWNAREKFEHGTNMKAWCRTILRNLHASYLRRSWRMLPLADETLAAIPSDSGEFSVSLDLLAVRNGIDLLPAEQREALLLVGAGGLSYIQAADVCGCAVGTMKSRVSRARTRLSHLMSENQAGYNSDASLRACEALNDLMSQVARIKSNARKPWRGQGTQRSSPPVLSDSAPREKQMLNTR